MSLFDTLGLILVFFAVAVAVILMHFSSGVFLNALSPVGSSIPEWNNTTTNIRSGFDTFDFILAGFFLGSTLFICFSAFVFQSHPFFTGLSVLFLVVVLFISPFISNSYGTIIETPIFSTEASAFPITNWIMQNLTIVIMGIAVITLVLGNAKPQFG